MDLSAIPAQPNIGLLHVVVEVPRAGAINTSTCQHQD